MSWIPKNFHKWVIEFFGFKNSTELSETSSQLPKIWTVTAHLHLSSQLATISNSNWFAVRLYLLSAVFRPKRGQIYQITVFLQRNTLFRYQIRYQILARQFISRNSWADNQFWASRWQQIHFSARILQIRQDNQISVYYWKIQMSEKDNSNLGIWLMILP